MVRSSTCTFVMSLATNAMRAASSWNVILISSILLGRPGPPCGDPCPAFVAFRGLALEL
jgi:hypothetical protein